MNIDSPGNGSGNWVTPFEQDPTQVNTIYVGYNRVYKSNNNGGIWTSVSQNFGNNLDNLRNYLDNKDFIGTTIQ